MKFRIIDLLAIMLAVAINAIAIKTATDSLSSKISNVRCAIDVACGEFTPKPMD